MSEQKPEQKPIDFIIEQLKLMRGSVIAASARVAGLSPADPLFEQWARTCVALLENATRVKVKSETHEAVIDRVTALLALPANAPPEDITGALTTAIKRLQELESRVGAATRRTEPPRAADSAPSTPQDVLEIAEALQRLVDQITEAARR